MPCMHIYQIDEYPSIVCYEHRYVTNISLFPASLFSSLLSSKFGLLLLLLNNCWRWSFKKNAVSMHRPLFIIYAPIHLSFVLAFEQNWKYCRFFGTESTSETSNPTKSWALCKWIIINSIALTKWFVQIIFIFHTPTFACLLALFSRYHENEKKKNKQQTNRLWSLYIVFFFEH